MVFYNLNKHYPTLNRSGNVLSFFILIAITIPYMTSCQNELPDQPKPQAGPIMPPDETEEPVNTNDAIIDLSNWKVTLPIGRPTEVSPPEILNYTTNETLKPFMYDDEKGEAIEFYAYPANSTANSSFSRTELREQMEPGSNSVNWTFAQGGKMRGTLAVPEVSKDASGKYHRIIIMQIHGRLTNQQRDLIGEDDNNAPPVLKIYWNNGQVRVRTKVLKDLNVSDKEILYTDAWKDDTGGFFKEEVGNDKFTLEVNVSEGKMSVSLNDDETFVYDDIHMKKWGIFENYFKAGNYLVTRDEGAFSKVKYYELEVSHD